MRESTEFASGWASTLSDTMSRHNREFWAGLLLGLISGCLLIAYGMSQARQSRPPLPVINAEP